MLTSHLLEIAMLASPLNHDRIARHAVLNGVPIPERTKAILEARGINVSELEHRIRHNMGFSL